MPDRLIAVRETGVSRHHGDPIEGPPETFPASQHYLIEEIKEVSDLGAKGNGNKVFSVKAKKYCRARVQRWRSFPFSESNGILFGGGGSQLGTHNAEKRF